MPPKPSQYPCLRCRLSRLSIGTQRRQFHAAGPNRARKAAYPNVKAADLGLLDPVAAVKSAVNTRPYTEKERNLLTRKYGREKMAIIDIGEEAVSAEDMEKQSLQRTDPMRIPYYDDFSTLRPIIDFPFEDGAQVPSKKEDRTGDGNKGLKAHDNEEQVDPHMRRLSQQTGLRPDIIKRLQVVDVVSHRVSNQTRMGKIPSLYRLTIAGDRNGMLGIGEGKAAEDDDARRQAMAAAVRNMRPIPRYEDRTIFGDVQGKVGASIVQLSSRPPGFGNRCQYLIFEMARAAGIKDLAARTPRSRNKMNVVKAAFKALLSQRLPEDIAKARGRKMVDVRKVYNGDSFP